MSVLFFALGSGSNSDCLATQIHWLWYITSRLRSICLCDDWFVIIVVGFVSPNQRTRFSISRASGNWYIAWYDLSNLCSRRFVLFTNWRFRAVSWLSCFFQEEKKTRDRTSRDNTGGYKGGVTETKRKRVTRADLSKRIYERIGKVIRYKSILQILGVIVSQISQDLVENRTISVRRFGTLSPYLRHGHLANDLSQGVVRHLPPRRSVKFHPHQSFLALLEERYVRFRQKKQTKRS